MTSRILMAPIMLAALNVACPSAAGQTASVRTCPIRPSTRRRSGVEGGEASQNSAPRSDRCLDYHERMKGRLMKATRILATAALISTTGLALHVGQAQQVGARRIDLQRHDLSVPGREVVQTIVELAPGTTAPRHTHPGEEIIYVLEGTWEYTVEGRPPVTLKAGDVLFIPAGAVHSARNVGTGRAAELATYIVEKGKPLLTVVE
jgi:quercetin dioxygenase-like cupin family protein